ncbi:MAG: M42 family metallopeptidase [Defluviitaleaceae bacterium]|nr:M42 family metallopeptidase [Defluviitaleaceae bacterium]
MDIKEFLKEVNAVPHVSGYENELTDVLTSKFSKYAEVSVDKFGNLVAHKKGTGNGPKVMLCAHMDEIGMMVSALCENGFVKFTNIGGIDKRNILAQEVTIHGREKVFGVIGIKPPHLTSSADMKKPVSFYDMAIDTGYSQEKLEKLVRPGDIITFNQDIAELKGGKITGKALDNSVGVAAMYCAMKNLAHYNHNADIYFVASAQEEVGLRGAKTATYNIKPDIGIAIDVTFGRASGLGEHESSELGKGPSIAVGPGQTRKLFNALKKVAGNNNIPYQVDVIAQGGGADFYEIQIGEGGVISILLSIPLKYMHSTVETAAISDIENCGKLISDYIISLQGAEEGEECYWKN